MYDQIIDRLADDYPGLSNEDWESTKRFVTQLIEWEVSKPDILLLCHFTEELSPDISEEHALKRMREILSKYPKVKKS